MKLLLPVWAVLALLTVSCTTLSSPPPAPMPSGWRIPSDFRIVGYFPGWSGDPAAVRFGAMTHVIYAFTLVDAAGFFLPLDDPVKLSAMVAQAHKAGVKAMISVGGWNGGSTKALDTVSSDPDLIRQFVTSTETLLDAYELDGVDLDWEFPNAATSAGHGALVAALAESLHSRGRVLSLAVTATGGNGQYISDQAWNSVDWLNVMAYDDGYGQPPSVHHSTYTYARASLDYWLGTRGLPRGKVVLGVPFYGRSLTDRKSRTYRSLLNQYPEAALSDVAGGFDYNGPDTIRTKLVNQARYRAGGVMVWQLNQDARGPGSLLSLIYDTVKEPTE